MMNLWNPRKIWKILWNIFSNYKKFWNFWLNGWFLNIFYVNYYPLFPEFDIRLKVGYLFKKPNEIPIFLLKILDKFHTKKASRILDLRYLYMGPLIKTFKILDILKCFAKKKNHRKIHSGSGNLTIENFGKPYENP